MPFIESKPSTIVPTAVSKYATGRSATNFATLIGTITIVIEAGWFLSSDLPINMGGQALIILGSLCVLLAIIATRCVFHAIFDLAEKSNSH
jgi:hypothetical protein